MDAEGQIKEAFVRGVFELDDVDEDEDEDADCSRDGKGTVFKGDMWAGGE